MLKRIFTSNTRIKLLTIFFLNENEEYFIRELTRKLDEQINSVRRELDNLKKAGLFRSKVKNRKKYYFLNKDFLFYPELKSMIIKSNSNRDTIAKDITKFGNISMLILSGLFIKKETTTVDMLIVGDVDKENLSEYLNNEVKTKRTVKFAIITEDDFRYRLNCNDRFIKELISDPENEIPINKILKNL